MIPIFFAYCEYDKISNIIQLADGNHKLLEDYHTVIIGLSDSHHF